MRLKTAATFEAPTIGVNPSSTSWTGMTCASLILEYKANPVLSQLVGYLESDSIKSPLVEFLISFPSTIEVLPNMGRVSKSDRRDTLCFTGLDKMPCYLMLNIPYSIVDPLEFPPFSHEKPSLPKTTLLLTAELICQGGLNLFPILLLRTEEPAIVDSTSLAIKGSDRMNFPGVNSNHCTIQRDELGRVFNYQLEVVAIIPNDFSHMGFGKYLTFGNRDSDWGISIPTGKLDMTTPKMDSRALEGDTEVFWPSYRWLSVGVSLLILEVALEGGKVFLYDCLGSLGMEFIRFDDFLYLGGLEPDALLVMDFVDIGDGLRVEPATFPGQGIQLLGFIQLDGDGAIHLYPRLGLDILPDSLGTHITSSRNKVGISPERRKFEEMGEFLSQIVGASTLKCLNQLMNCHLGITRNKKVEMVRLYFQSQYFNLLFLCDILKNYLQAFLNFLYQYWSSPLRAPYNVVVYQIYLVCRMLILHIVYSIAQINKRVNTKTGGLAHSSPAINCGAF